MLARPDGTNRSCCWPWKLSPLHGRAANHNLHVRPICGESSPMAKLHFNVHGFEFQSGIDVLRKSAQAGLSALSDEIKALEQQLEDYRRIGEFDGEHDEDGVVIWERDEFLEHAVGLAREALMELRKAFAIAALHHWERSVQRWLGQANDTAPPTDSDARRKRLPRGYDELSSAAKAMGYPAHGNLLRVVTLANTLKHNTEDLGRKL